MKSFLLAAVLLSASFAAGAQCDKPLQLSASKTEFLDGSGNLQNAQDEATMLEIGKDTLVIKPGNEPNEMRAAIVSKTCTWTVPFKEGKSVYKATLASPDGVDTKALTITIEGKDGKLTLLAVLDDEPGRQIRLPLETFQEKS